MTPLRHNSNEYSAVPDVENVHEYTMPQSVVNGTVETTDAMKIAESDTYNLSFAFSLLSGTVWLSMFLWGIWIAAFYSIAIANRNWHNFNIIFPDMWTDNFPIAFIAISIHFIGAVFMSLAGAFQLVKYIRKHYAVLHRWVGRLYIISSILASVGGLVFIFNKGSYGGREADIAFAIYGFIFLWSCLACYYYAAIAKDFSTHKLWAWRLYSLSLAAWVYRADYYYWMLVFGKQVACVWAAVPCSAVDPRICVWEQSYVGFIYWYKTQAMADGRGCTMIKPVDFSITLSTGPFMCPI